MLLLTSFLPWTAKLITLLIISYHFCVKDFFYISFRFVLLTKNAYELIPTSLVISRDYFSHKNSHSCLSNLADILDFGHQF